MIAAFLFDLLAGSLASVQRFASRVVEFDQAMMAGDANRLDQAVGALLRHGR